MTDIDYLSEEAKEIFKFHVPENVKNTFTNCHTHNGVRGYGQGI